MNKPILEAKGVNGQIDVYEQKIVIKRKGFLSFITHGMSGEKEIMINQISAIQFKKAGLFTNGYIQFVFLGSQESKKALFDATNDENTVMFVSTNEKGFLQVKEFITDKLSQNNQTVFNSSTPTDELVKLAELVEKGFLSKEEFEAKKKQLLNL